MKSTTKAPRPGAYRQAQLLARSRAGALTDEAAKNVLAAVDRYVDRLTLRLADLPAGTDAARKVALAAAIKIAKDSSASLSAELAKAVADKRLFAFREIAGVWNEATKAAALSAGVPSALLGAVQTPALTMAGAFESLGGVPFLKSLSATGKAAGLEVSQILRDGITSNVRPDELARRLRPYVSGAEVFEKAFPKADERFKAIHTARARLPKEIRGAAGRVRSNSLRIAYSEIHNARAEAELQAFAIDPLIHAVEWELSPFRGSHAGPDACDVFAVNDWYGLGKGRYPLDAVPLPPHPRDRCERVPVFRPPDQWHLPKPIKLKRKLKPSAAHLGAMAKSVTSQEAKRIREVVRGQLQQLDQHSSASAMRKLVSYGEKSAGELLEIAAARQALLADLAQIATDAEAAAIAAASEPTVIGKVTFPTKLEGEAFVSAKLLVDKAAHKSKVALQALKDAGADTSKLDAHLAAQAAKAAEKKAAAKAAKKLEAPPAPPPPVIEPIAPPIAPIQVTSAQPLKFPPTLQQVESLQATLKDQGIYLLTKTQISQQYDEIAAALDAITGADEAAQLQALGKLKGMGANVAKIEKKLGLSGKPLVAPPAPKPVAPPPPRPPKVASAENVLFTKVGAQAGSNQGGFYVGKDGVKRYVKVYKDPSQAYGEHVANQVYAKLGLGAPESLTFKHEGQLYYASRIVEGAENATLKSLGLTKDRARKALDGFAADILTGNWDAPGLGLDNMVEVGGKVYRIDNGSAFLFRAQGTKKPSPLLVQISEWEGFAPGAKNLNPDYANLFKTAGYSAPEDLGEALVKQVDQILAVEQQVGGWAKYVDEIAGDMATVDRTIVKQMLAERTKLLKAKRDALSAALTKPAPVPVPAPVVAPPPAAVKAGIAPVYDVSALEASLSGKKALGVKQIAWKHGVSVSKFYLDTPAKVKDFKVALVKAVKGDQAAIAKLQSFGAHTTILESKLEAAYKLAGVVPPVAPPPVINAVPHVPADLLIKPAQVDGVLAASEVKQPLYWQGGNTSLNGLKASGVDVSKLPAGHFGFEMDTAVTALKPTSKGYAKLAIASKKPLTVGAADTGSALDAAIENLHPGWKKLAGNDAAKRQFLLDQGYDSVVVTGPGGKIRTVIALKPDIVKVVDEVVPVPVTVAPSVPVTTKKGFAAVDGSLANRSPSTASLAPVAGETSHARKIREARASFRSAVADHHREHLGKSTAAGLQLSSDAARAAKSWRDREMLAQLVNEANVTPAQAQKIARKWDSAIGDWFGSSSSNGAAVMKRAAEDVHGIDSTTFHNGYFDHNAAMKKQLFENIADNTTAGYGVTREQLRIAYEIDMRLARASMMEAMGIEEGETFKVWRGVQQSYFTSHKIPVPALGQEVVVTMNSLSSFSMSRPFGGVVLELEATLDDVALQYSLLSTGSFQEEREIWIIGRPRKMTRIR